MFATNFVQPHENLFGERQKRNGFVRAVRGFRVVRVTISIHLDWQHSKPYFSYPFNLRNPCNPREAQLRRNPFMRLNTSLKSNTDGTDNTETTERKFMVLHVGEKVFRIV